LFAQNEIPIGTWRTHYSYQSVDHVIAAGDKIYAASTYGLFYYDQSDNSINKITNLDGLSDVGVSAFAYHENFDLLIIGYRNGNLDLLMNNEIINLPDIKLSDFDRKEIHDIELAAQGAFLATDFGVVLVDLINYEVIEVYREIGSNGSNIESFQVELLDDSIFVNTNQGLLAASLTQGNLLDFRNWNRKELPDADGTLRNVSVWLGKLVFTLNGKIFSYYRGVYDEIAQFEGEMVNMVSRENELYLLTNSKIQRISLEGFLDPLDDDLIKKPRDLAIDENGAYWVADGFSGLIRRSESMVAILKPDGPIFDHFEKFLNLDDMMMAFPGRLNQNFVPSDIPGGFSIFQNGAWKNYSHFGPSGSLDFPYDYPVTDAKLNQENGKVYFSTLNGGLVVWDQDQNFEKIDQLSPGVSFTSTGPNDQLLFTSIAQNADGIWVAQYNADHSLHNLNNEVWQGFPLLNKFPVSVKSDQAGNLWMIRKSSSQNGATVFDPSNGIEKIITNQNNLGGLPGAIVNDIVIDLQGEIWFGTDEGIAFFPGPFSVFGNNTYNVIVPIFEGRFLFQNEKINALAVDGGNQKWIATNQGLWLFDEDFREVIHHFTTTNSPLPSNQILELGLNQSNGELFIATDKGILSYRTTSSGGTESISAVKIFPNPVYQNFNGEVGISGLVEDTIIKIVDTGGRLVYQTRSVGGTASWDVRTFNGDRAATGIYWLLSSDETGNETFVGKLAVIN